jgi:hypothetical protein
VKPVTYVWRGYIAFPVIVPMSGCSQAPSIDIMGSLFPAWLLCIVLGTILAALSHWLLLRRGIKLVYPPLTYLCLGAIFTFATWLIFF